MPLLSEFFGIKIYIYWDDHVPPHFHAEYNGHHVLVDIEENVVIKGVLPANKLKLVLGGRNSITMSWWIVGTKQNLIKCPPELSHFTNGG